MASQKSVILKAFNQHLKDFIDDIQTLFPTNVNIRTMKNSALTLVKMNPRKVIELWFTKVFSKYGKQIMNEDIEFFLNKDYSDDLKELDNDVDVDINIIEELRAQIRVMDESNKQMALKYVKEMTQLSSLYYSLSD